MQRSKKAGLGSVFSAVDLVLPEWIPGPICPRIPDFNGIPESESSILDSKDKGYKFNIHRSWEFWNPYYLKFGDHHIMLRPCVCVSHSYF